MSRYLTLQQSVTCTTAKLKEQGKREQQEIYYLLPFPKLHLLYFAFFPLSG